MQQFSETPEKPAPAPSRALDVSSHVEYIKELAQIVADEKLSKLEVETGGVKITLKGPPAPSFSASAPVLSAVPAVAPPPTSTSAPPPRMAEKLTPLVSPMVGVFYRAPSPSDPDFVAVGDTVSRGQTIGLVEAMKVFNEITAEHSGVVAAMPIESGTLVETGQTVILLK